MPVEHKKIKKKSILSVENNHLYTLLKHGHMSRSIMNIIGLPIQNLKVK